MIAYSNHDKDLLLANTARTYSRLTFYKNGQQLIVCTEDDYLQEWDYEDYRYVPEQGFVGQFVERILDGKLLNLPSNIDISDSEFQMEVGVEDPEQNTINYYSYGNFLITKVSDTDTNGTVSFEACDYTKKFNQLYEDRITYPCTAGELFLDVCNQVGVQGNSRSGIYYCTAYVAKSDDDFIAGAYSLYDPNTERYYNFTSTKPIKRFEVVYRDSSDNRYLYHNYIDDNDQMRTTAYRYTSSTTATGTVLAGRNTPLTAFTYNSLFVIENNQFDENATCRDVIKALAQLGLSWARVGTDNKVYIDFVKKSQSSVNTYTTIDEDQYYSATKTGDTYGPVTQVLVGMSTVEGENITYPSGAADTTVLTIYDNPLTYTEELRKIATIGIADALIGITYTPVEVDTIGYPWLDGDDYCQIDDIDNDTYYTYPFNRTITYKGYLESSIKSIADGKIETEYKYEGDVDRRVSRTEIIVDKHEGQISLINEHVDKVDGDITGLEDKYSDVLSQIDTANTSITQLSSRVDTVQTSTYTKTQIQQIVNGTGVDGVKVTAVSTTEAKFDKDGMHYSKTGAPTTSTINELGLEVDATSGEDKLLYAGYDNDSTSSTYGQSIVKTANLTVSNWTIVGTHGRFEKYTDENDFEGVGFFLV